jgi:hypothetical protein
LILIRLKGFQVGNDRVDLRRIEKHDRHIRMAQDDPFGERFS